MNDKTMTIYAPGTEVELKNARHLSAIVEKVIIGGNGTVQYQLIIYTPQRDQLVVNDYEVAGIAKETKKTIGLGFHAVAQDVSGREVQIYVDEKNQVLDVVKPEGILVRFCNGDEYNALKEKKNG